LALVWKRTQSPQVAALKMAIFSPLPCKVSADSVSPPTSPDLCSSRWTPLQKPNNARPFYSDDIEEEATHELHEVLGRKTGESRWPGWSPTLEARCWSRSSTSATTPRYLRTPPPPSTSPPEGDHGNQHITRRCGRGGQSRKLFIGGIPQGIDQNAFCTMFCHFGKIEKAWLQLFHADDQCQGSTKKHRGFGFVIFQDESALDQLLGDDFSRFISFRDNLKLEVKRAVGKNNADMMAPDKKMDRSLQQQGPDCRLSPASSRHSCSSLSPQARQPRHAWLYADLPYVPPFPQVESTTMDPSVSNAPFIESSSPALLLWPKASHLEQQLLSDFILAVFEGQTPRNNWELAEALREAGPDCYED